MIWLLYPPCLDGEPNSNNGSEDCIAVRSAGWNDGQCATTHPAVGESSAYGGPSREPCCIPSRQPLCNRGEPTGKPSCVPSGDPTLSLVGTDMYPL